jgi:mannose-6-phosphate isomerase-like protein (cupin superfamily)
MNTMIRATFEADCLRDGNETSKRNLEPNQQNEAHAHGCDAGVFVLDGSVTLAFGESPCNCEMGDTFSVPAGPCTRSTEADDVRYVAGRRSTAEAAG